jgi:hypothetical protein
MPRQPVNPAVDEWTCGFHGGHTKGGALCRQAIRGLAKLEAEERDRCATMATKAVAAGLAERQVRLAEQQGTLLASVIRAVLDDLDLSPEQAAKVAEVVPRHLRAVA